MHWHNLSIEETLKELVKPDQGLSINEVRKRQQNMGGISRSQEKEFT